MEVVTINNRIILAFFLACLLLSSCLLFTTARTEPEGAAAEEAGKEPATVEPEPKPDVETDQQPKPTGSAEEEAGDQKEPKTEPEQEEEKEQGETKDQKEGREKEELAEQDEEKKDPKKAAEPKPEEQEQGEAKEEKEAKEEEEEEGEKKEAKPTEDEDKKDDGDDDDDDDEKPEGKEDAKAEQGEDKKAEPAPQGGASGPAPQGGAGYDQRKVDEKIDQLCKAAKDPNLCFNSIVAYIGNKQFTIPEINPDWILKMQVNATIAQLVHIQTFIRDMLKQRPQDQILIKCKDAYFNFANDLGNAANAADRPALKTLATNGPNTLNNDCTSLVDAQPSATTPEIASTLKEVPTTSAPYLLNIAQLADQPKRKRK